ncbi:MAG: universal stress protein [Mangrovicoccus sp.]
MAYKSLLTVLRDPEPSAAHFTLACSLAEEFDAHLQVLCLGIDQMQIGFYYTGATAMMTPDTIAAAEEQATEIKTMVETALKPTDIRYSCEAMVAHWGALGQVVSRFARYADLVILPETFGEGRSPEDETITEAALFQGPAPILTVPDSWAGKTLGKNIVIASNQSPEEMTAVRAALPQLMAAGTTNIAIVDPPSHGPDRSDPGGALSEYLGRHGVRAEISVLARNHARISQTLNDHLEARDADLLIMGAYGHSRLREAVLGGPTRDMLTDPKVPILMAH